MDENGFCRVRKSHGVQSTESKCNEQDANQVSKMFRMEPLAEL